MPGHGWEDLQAAIPSPFRRPNSQLRSGFASSEPVTIGYDEQHEMPPSSSVSRAKESGSAGLDFAEIGRSRANSQNASRACESCRLLKSRCVLGPEPVLSGQCQRCANFGRVCVFTQRSKSRRPRRTAARFRELERKLEALASVLERRSTTSKSAIGDDDDIAEAEGSLVGGGQSLSFAGVVGNEVTVPDSLSAAIPCEPHQRQRTGGNTKEARSRELSKSEQQLTTRWRVPVSKDAANPMLAPLSPRQRQQNTPRDSAAAREVNNQPFLSMEMETRSHDTTPKPSAVSEVTPSVSPRRSRRSHTKSRSGCKTCKTRKIKCDEKKSRCLRCRERGLPCDYASQEPTPSRDSSNSNAGSPWSSASVSSMSMRSATSQVRQALEPDLAYDVDYHTSASGTSGLLETLQHFESVAFSTMGSPVIQKAMRKNGLLLAQDAPFLFHAILAYSAHHLSYLRPARQSHHHRSAIYHKTRALQLYTKELSGPIGRHNMDSIFAACMLLAVLAYCPSSDDIDPTQSWVFSDQPEAISWLLMQFGFLTLKCTTGLQDHLASSIWLPVFLDSDAWFAFHVARTGAEGLPPTFVELCGIDESSTDDNNPYHSALRLLMAIMQAEAGMLSFVKSISFPGRMRREFFGLVRGKDPVALLIVGYWLGHMCKIEQWWCVSRVRSECLAICTYLDGWTDSRIQDLLQVPMQACGYAAAEPALSGFAGH